ncbi:hypothetical protein KXW58_006457 [Aspergillus fumigatus]|nr:hypothetical protein KXW58_006457 [Aspergillus fumigatus]
MPVDNETRKKNRLIQYRAICLNGSLVESPCILCSRRGVVCIMDSKSRNCAECTRSGRKCEKRFHSEHEWNRVLNAQEKIKEDISQAESTLLVLNAEQSKLLARLSKISSKTTESMARIRRLRRQEEILKTKSGRMLDHDTLVMDQLDEENPPTPGDEGQILAAVDDPSLSQMLRDPSF